MNSVSEANEHDKPLLVDELVPRETPMVENVFVGLEDAIGQPVISHELSKVLGGMEAEALEES